MWSQEEMTAFIEEHYIHARLAANIILQRSVSST